MAQSANAAYMLWRQFSGEAKAPAGMKLQGPTAQRQQVSIQRGTSDSEALADFAGTMQDFFKYGEKKHKEEVDPKVKAWMASHTMEEYQQKMREGNVPFQNDKVAMDILHNQAAYNLALQTEEGIQAEIKKGTYKTMEEADKARVDALNGARNEYILSMGISPDNKAFSTGFNRDDQTRRATLMSLQTDVTDKYLRTQAKTQVQADLLAPLTEDFVKAAPGKVTSTYIANTVKRAETMGQIRSDADKVETYSKAMDALQGMTGGADAINELGNHEVELYGVKASLRTHLGGGVFDQAVLKARQTEQQQSSERQGKLGATLMSLQNKADVNGLLALRNNLEAESGGKMTGDIQAVDQTIQYVNRKMQADNAAMATKLEKEREKQLQMFTGVQGLNKLISGDGLVSPDGKDLGFKDEAQAREGEEYLLNSIADEGERLQTAMKLAGVRRDGFAANALKAWGSQADAAWTQYQNKLQRGEQGLEVPPNVQRMVNLYDSNPEAFTMLNPDSKYIAAVEAGRNIGASMEDIARSQAEWGKLPKDVKKAAEDAMTLQVSKVTSQDPAYVAESMRALTGPLLTMGVAPVDAVKMARASFDRQHEKINGYPIHKGFFQVTGDRESYSAGLQSFNELQPKVLESIGNPKGSSLAYWYDGANQSVIAFNLQTGQQAAPITRGELQVHAQQRAIAEETKLQEKVDKAIKQEDYDRRVKLKRQERGTFPGNQLEGDSGFSGAPKRKTK